MHVSATVVSRKDQLETTVQTNGSGKPLAIAQKPNGEGSAINGGELLVLALATCFCNDLYREARKRGILVSQVEVVASGDFGAEGEPGCNFRYKANVTAEASEAEISALIAHTDQVAEIHNTLRKGITVRLS